MMNKYWYVCIQSAEDSDLYVVQLTNAEFNAVKKYYETRKPITEGGWSGWGGIYSKKYNTKEEAIEAICNKTYYDE